MTVALGVDVSERRGLDVVALTAARTVAGPPRRGVSPDELEALLAALRPAVVAIDSPPGWARAGASRQGERDLAALGVACFRTPAGGPASQRPFYNWMRVGQAAFAAAGRAGYRLYTGGRSVDGCALEVFPHASAVALAGRQPPAGATRRPGTKAAWRRAVLAGAGVDTTPLATLDQIDAALAALTGLLAREGRYFALGDPAEGLLVLPGAHPAGRYLREA